MILSFLILSVLDMHNGYVIIVFGGVLIGTLIFKIIGLSRIPNILSDFLIDL